MWNKRIRKDNLKTLAKKCQTREKTNQQKTTYIRMKITITIKVCLQLKLYFRSECNSATSIFI